MEDFGLDDLIAKEKENNGKVLVVLNNIETIKALVARYNDKSKYGAGFAAAVLSSSSSNQTLHDFRSKPHPWVIFSTEQQVGAGFNLCPVDGADFETLLAVRLMPTATFVSKLGARLVGPGQTKPPREITFVNVFAPSPMEDAKSALTLLNMLGQITGAKQKALATTISRSLIAAGISAEVSGKFIQHLKSGQTLNSLDELHQAHPSIDPSRLIAQLRPQSFDQMWVKDRRKKARMQASVLEGKGLEDEREETQDLGLLAPSEEDMETVLSRMDIVPDNDRDETSLTREETQPSDHSKTPVTVIFASSKKVLPAPITKRPDWPGPQESVDAVRRVDMSAPATSEEAPTQDSPDSQDPHTAAADSMKEPELPLDEPGAIQFLNELVRTENFRLLATIFSSVKLSDSIVRKIIQLLRETGSIKELVDLNGEEDYLTTELMPRLIRAMNNASRHTAAAALAKSA